MNGKRRDHLQQAIEAKCDCVVFITKLFSRKLMALPSSKVPNNLKHLGVFNLKVQGLRSFPQIIANKEGTTVKHLQVSK